MKELHELINTVDPAWPLVLKWAKEATNSVEILPAPVLKIRERSLLDLQVTTRSPMGAIVYESGGILVDDGWIRILGSGHPRLSRSLADWNSACHTLNGKEPPPYLLVADDAVGGFFAIDGGGLGFKPGNVCYSAPDTLEWEEMEGGYTWFINFCFSGDLEKYYQNLRWPSWKEDIRALRGDQAFHIYPPMSTKGPAIGEWSRRAVPIEEIFGLHVAPLPEIK